MKNYDTLKYETLRVGIILLTAIHFGLFLGGNLSSLVPLVIGPYILYVDFKSGKKS